MTPSKLTSPPARDPGPPGAARRAPTAEALPLPVIRVDRFLHVTYANPAAARVLGMREPASLEGLTLDRLPLIGVAEGDFHPLVTLARAGETARGAVNLPATGEQLMVHITPDRARNNPGGAVLVLCPAGGDSRESTRLRRRVDALSGALDAVPVAVVVTDLHTGVVSAANRVACQLTGIAAEELVGATAALSIEGDATTRLRVITTHPHRRHTVVTVDTVVTDQRTGTAVATWGRPQPASEAEAASTREARELLGGSRPGAWRCCG
ncbi:MAG: PAS domain-containing protein [Thermoleophilia bacterium]